LDSVGQIREPLVLPFVALASGVFAAHYARFEAIEVAVPFSAALTLTLLTCRLAPRLTRMAALTTIAIAGIAFAEYHRPGAAPRVEADQGESLLVSGCVVEPMVVRDGRGRFVVEVAERARATVSMRIDPETQPPTLPYGTLVEFAARIRVPRNYGNPGAFDYAHYLARRETYWTAAVLPRTEVKILPGRCGSVARAWLQSIRTAALARLDDQYDGEMAGFMRALLLGDDDRLDQNTSDEFRKTGTYHAIVISGLHISLVAGSVLWLLRRAFAPVWLRLGAACLVAWAYTLIAGGDAPVLRAAVGFTLGLVAAAVHRRVRVLNLLAAVGILFLAFDPAQLLEPSFQLSFAAVAAIAALANPCIDRSSAILRTAARTIDYVRPSKSFSPRIASLRVELRLLAQTIALLTRAPESWARFAVGRTSLVAAVASEAIILSAAVQFALTVPSVFYFHRVAFTSVFANLLAVPILNGAVGLGLTALTTGSSTLSSFAARLTEFSTAVVAWFAQLEPAWRPATPTAALAIGFLLSLAVLAITLRHKPKLGAQATALSGAVALAMCLYTPANESNRWLEFTAIDVGQGDSLLLVFPNGQTMLVDGGGFPTFRGTAVRRMDIGEQVVSPYLWTRGFRKLDIVAVTHAHDDHAQGLSAILRNFQPAEFWSGAIPLDAPVLKVAREQGATLWQPRLGMERQFGGATVRILAPSPDYVAGRTARNDDSLVFEVTYGQRRFVLTGDVERAVEAQLQPGRADVLKVAHHGSKTSTLPEFLAVARPTFAVVSVGEGNLYNHPHPDVLARLREYHVTTLRTDRAGLTRFRTDGNRLEIETNWLDWRAD
jgi:competence protein ComEC